MKSMRLIAVAAGVGLSLALVACTTPSAKPVDTGTDPAKFHIVTSATTFNVLVAPENAGATSDPLAGTISQVGSCLGLTLTDGTLVTVVWPYGTLALALKPGLEVPANLNQGLPTARFAPGQPAELTGGYYDKTSWIGEVPADCPLGTTGVFVVATAKHPKPADG